jgi:hypothetical protein
MVYKGSKHTTAQAVGAFVVAAAELQSQYQCQTARSTAHNVTQKQRMTALCCTSGNQSTIWHALLGKGGLCMFSTRCIHVHARASLAMQHSNQHPSNRDGVTARATKLQHVRPVTFTGQTKVQQGTPYCAAPSSVKIANMCLVSTLSCIFLAFNVVHCGIHTIRSIVNAAHTTTPGILQPILTRAAAAELTTMVHRTP